MVQEGAATLFAPAGTPTGPEARRKDAPFYNPAMRTNRDLSVHAAQAWRTLRGRDLDAADVLAGSGARSLRWATETTGLQVHANDADPKAVDAIRRGAEHNGVDVAVTHGPAHRFLAARRYDIVDIDPYGSPTPFLDAAVQATRHDGLLCITATDTAALCGRFPRVCSRRYGATHRLHKHPWRAEVGLRILAATAIQAAGRFDRAATPILSVFGGHWMRIMLQIQDGRQRADRLQKRLGWIESRDGRGAFAPGPVAEGAGPAWTGPLHDRSFVQALQAVAAPRAPKTEALLPVLAEEADAPPFWIDLGDARRSMGVDGPRRGALIEALRRSGCQATRTHLSPEGVRTDADDVALRHAWTQRD